MVRKHTLNYLNPLQFIGLILWPSIVNVYCVLSKNLMYKHVVFYDYQCG